MINILRLIKFNLKLDKKKIFMWSISSFAIIFIYMILFPYVQDIAKVEMQMMPEELLQVFGISSYTDFSNFTNYFESVYNMFLLAITIYSVILGVSLVQKEEKNKTIEFLYSLSLTRSNIIISKVVIAVITVICIIVSSFLSTSLAGFINGGTTFNIKEIIDICLNSMFVTFIAISLGIFLSGGYLTKSNTAVGACSIVIMYLCGVLSSMLGDNYEFLKYLSPFEVIKTDNISAISLYLLIAIVLIIIGVKNYSKRDLLI